MPNGYQRDVMSPDRVRGHNYSMVDVEGVPESEFGQEVDDLAHLYDVYWIDWLSASSFRVVFHAVEEGDEFLKDLDAFLLTQGRGALIDIPG